MLLRQLLLHPRMSVCAHPRTQQILHASGEGLKHLRACRGGSHVGKLLRWYLSKQTGHDLMTDRAHEGRQPRPRPSLVDLDARQRAADGQQILLLLRPTLRHRLRTEWGLRGYRLLVPNEDALLRGPHRHHTHRLKSWLRRPRPHLTAPSRSNNGTIDSLNRRQRPLRIDPVRR